MKAILVIQPVEWAIVESTPKAEMSLALEEGEYFYLDAMGDRKQDCLLTCVRPDEIEIMLADAELVPIIDGKPKLPLEKNEVIKIQAGESCRLETLTLDAGIIYTITLERVA